eukprot:5278186-Pyramimonas_sp.AAC.1
MFRYLHALPQVYRAQHELPYNRGAGLRHVQNTILRKSKFLQIFGPHTHSPQRRPKNGEGSYDKVPRAHEGPEVGIHLQEALLDDMFGQPLLVNAHEKKLDGSPRGS